MGTMILKCCRLFLTVEEYYSHGLMTSPPCHQRQMESSVLIFHDRSVGRPERERERKTGLYMGMKELRLF